MGIDSYNRTSTLVVTDSEVKDPTPLPTPHAWMIIVRPVPIRKKTNGGIILTDSARRDFQNLTTVGRVLAIGPDAFKSGVQGGTTKTYGVGDYVAWSRMRGERFVYKGVSLVLLADDEVLMKLDNPEDLDPEKLVE